jgi:hypothetical protein
MAMLRTTSVCPTRIFSSESAFSEEGASLGGFTKHDLRKKPSNNPRRIKMDIGRQDERR